MASTDGNDNISWMRPKLAELCGLEYFALTELVRTTGGRHVNWRPDEDVAQAIRCLEALSSEWSWSIRRGDVMVKNIVRDDELNPTHIAFAESIPHNICLAIADALDWKETP